MLGSKPASNVHRRSFKNAGGTIFTRKAMAQCGLSLVLDVRSSEQPLTSELKKSIAQHLHISRTKPTLIAGQYCKENNQLLCFTGANIICVRGGNKFNEHLMELTLNSWTSFQVESTKWLTNNKSFYRCSNIIISECSYLIMSCLNFNVEYSSHFNSCDWKNSVCSNIKSHRLNWVINTV